MTTLDGKTLREARNALGLSQEEAAEMLAVSLVTYQRWEQGKAQPRPYNLREIRLKFKQGFEALGLIEAETKDQDDRSARQQENAAPIALSIIPSTPSADESTIEMNETQAPLPMTIHLLSLAYMDYSTNNEKPSIVRQVLKEFDKMNTTNKNYQITRREAVRSLAAYPIASLGLFIPGSIVEPKQYGKALAQFAVALEGCAALYQSNDTSDVFQAFKDVSKYLPILESIAKDSPTYRNEALDLATRYALLKALLGRICTSMAETISYAREAVFLSKATGDISLQLSAYVKLAWSYFHEKKYTVARATMREGEAVLKHYQQMSGEEPLPSSIIGSFHSALALIQTKTGESPDSALGIATESVPMDDHIAFMVFTPSVQLNEAALICCSAGDQAGAMKWLEKRIDPETLKPRVPQGEWERVKAINTMGLSSLKTKNRDMERTIYLWTAGIQRAKELQYEFGFDQAVANYEGMEMVWPGEKRIAELRELIEHW